MRGAHFYCVYVSLFGRGAVSVAYICSPHHLVVEGLKECLPLDSDNLDSVVGFAESEGGLLIAAFVAAVDGYKIVVAAAGNLQCDACVVVYDYRAGIQAVRSNGGEHKYIGVRGDDGAACA